MATTHVYANDIPIKQRRPPMHKQTNSSSVDLELSPNTTRIGNVSDTYDYAFDQTHENSSVVPSPPTYDMIDTQQQPPRPNPTVVSSMESSPNTVKQTNYRSSRIPLCRMFLLVVASLIIGGAIGGTISYLLATGQGVSQTTCQTCPDVNTEGVSQTTCQTCPDVNTEDFPADCKEVIDRGNVVSGEYMISPLSTDTASRTAFPVWCDMETDGGGWTVFQRRKDGSVDFFLGWSDYTNGLGNVNSEHWLGNQKIHEITSQGDYELRIDMADFEGNNSYAKYSDFNVGGLDTHFMLTVGGYSGDAGDSLLVHNNQSFTTKDVDNDSDGTNNCASLYEGAWWYAACHHSNLNGRYLRGSTTTYANGVVWNTWKGYYYSLRVSVMKIRRVA